MKKLTRRDFLRVSAMTAAGVVAAACAPATPQIVEKEVIKEVPVEKPVIVEKEVIKEVEKLVVVEKVVTPTSPPPTPKPVLSAQEQWRAETVVHSWHGTGAPELCNPLLPGVEGAGLMCGVCFEQLWLLNFETGETTPWLASVSVPDLEWNEDFTQVDVPLREGIEWSDGEPFTAEDVAFSLRMVRDNPGMRYGGTMEEWLKEAEAIDSLTCRITLNETNPRFLHQHFTARICSGFIPLPKHIFEKVDDPTEFQFYDLDKGWPVVTGPYKLVKTTQIERIFERRDDWWGAKTGFRKLPAPKRVAYVKVETREKAAAMLENNELDYYCGLELSTYIVLKERRPDMVSFDPNPPYEWTDPCPWYLGFNCGREPWNDRDMRWAVAYGIDQVGLAKITHSGFGVPAKTPYPTYPILDPYFDAIKDLTDEYDCTVYDPDKAKQIIESKGYEMGADGAYVKDGKRLEAEFIATPAAITTAQATMISAFLREIGIDAPPKFLSVSAYFDRKNTREYDLECSWTICGSVADPFADMDNFHSGHMRPEGETGGTPFGYASPEFDKLVDEMALIPPGDPRLMPKFHEIMEVWLKDLPACPLDQSARIVAMNPKYWTNWPTQEGGNNYVQPTSWWMQWEEISLRLEPAG